MFRLFNLFLAGFSLVATSSLPAMEYFVDGARGRDDNLGRARDSAWASLGHAVTQLRAGDRLVVRAGEYFVREQGLVLRDLAGVTVLAEVPGEVVLNASPREASLGQLAWTERGDGLYAAPWPGPGSIAAGFCDGDYLHNYRLVDDLRRGMNRTEGYHSGGKYFPGPEWGLAFGEGEIWVRLPQRQNPHGKRLHLVRADGAALRVTNSPGAVIDGFVIRGRSNGVEVDAASSRVTVRNCVFLGATHGVMIDADHCLVEWCEAQFEGLARFNAGLMSRDTMIYYFLKDRGLEGGLVYSKKVPSPRFMEARYNYIHQMFDGDGLGQFDDSRIHHSVYVDCFDNGVEFEPNVKGKSGANLRFDHNWIEGFARGAISHQQNGVTREDSEKGWFMDGPHYVDHNVIIMRGDYARGWKPWNAIKSRPWNNAVSIHYYHNVIWTQTRAELFWRMPEWEAGLANMVWKNNVLISPEWVRTDDPPFRGEANVLVAPSAVPGLTGAGGWQTPSADTLKFSSLAQENLRPQADSPLVGAAVRWTPELPIDGQNRTIGVFDVDEPSPTAEWPRPKRRVFSR